MQRTYINARSGSSPFDRIADYTEDGEPHWDIRKLVGELGYSRLDGLDVPLDRATKACKNTGENVDYHFRRSEELVDFGRGGRSRKNIHLTRLGCYLLAMNCDPNKPEVANAQAYFAGQTRRAELELPPVAQPAPDRARVWSDRVNKIIVPLIRYINIHHPGCFTILTTAVGSILALEDELARHFLPTGPSDLPDGSIGIHWSRYRQSLGRIPSEIKAPLQVPLYGIDVEVRVYTDSERGEFEAWFAREYCPVHLPKYLEQKPSFKPHGRLVAASAADNACRKLTGRPTNLKNDVRRQLSAVGDFAPVGTIPPALESPKRSRQPDQPKNPQRDFFDLLG